MITLPTIYAVACHTDNVGAGTTFVAIPGTKRDGLEYVPLALEKGASRIIVQEDVIIPDSIGQLCRAKNVLIEVVHNARLALALESASAYNYPAKKLKIIGVTGTKGKTTSVFLLHHILQHTGHKVAMLTGVYNMINNQRFEASLTTAQPDYLHMFFDQCVQAGVEYVVMEAAAQAFSLHRLEGIEFTAAIFTNFSQEHAEFYSSIEQYFAAKKKILEQLTPNGRVYLNDDDPRLHELLENTSSKKYQSFGTKPGVMYRAVHQMGDMHAIEMLVEDATHSHEFFTDRIVGLFNCTNLLGVISCAHGLGISFGKIDAALQTFTGVPGRVERIKLANEAIGIVDYAHNPSSFAALLSMLRQSTDHLIVVFGCGGDRDRTKRPVMGSIAKEHGDVVILTSDNPRSEQLHAIIEEILGGIPDQTNVHIQHDRAQAIKLAVEHAKPGTIIAVLGKG
ncbi:MAG: UDP-N-acetylmuramoyl-L-alanyl-D-glutamate--2,6-diaminopimelate ligase, partial [Gammaproteobacteria bacterium]|nr:UDP-N-acetylmuramoyl-L-alanyl-D-glutamate--2,6-diaminopimelate ligase [Gammaproteobacteria bacterium]